MARIEWAALGGGEVETVVSMLIFNEHPRASRIRPSQGDFGIDVLVPHDEAATALDVLQIKKFATNLDASQKRQIEDSFQRVLLGLVRRDVPLADWYLVMPLDPTLENARDWFAEMPETVITRMSADTELALTPEEIATIEGWRWAPGRIIEWKGLTYCETLASKYWFVADYYLHGGSERIKGAVTEVAKILQRDVTLADPGTAVDGSSILEPGDLREHLVRLAHVLDGDPHFRYGISVDPVVTQLIPEPGLVAAAQEVASDGTCTTFRIYARFAEALNERPIPIHVKFELEPGTAEARAFDDWRKYGKQLTAVVGVDAELPGGLGGSFEAATATISPVDVRSGETRYRIVTPNGEVVAELLFSVTTTTGFDGTGLYVQGQDPSGTVSIEGHFDATDRSGGVEFSFSDPAGHEAVDVAAAANFAAGLSHPYRLQVAGKHGPFRDASDILEPEPLLPLSAARYITALAALQSHTTTPIVVPDLATVTGALAQRVLTAAKLLDGQTIVGTWTAFEFAGDASATLDTGGHYQLAVIEPLKVAVGDTALDLGTTQNTLLSAKLTEVGGGRLKAEPQLNDAGHRELAPHEPTPHAGRAPVRYRAAPKS
ncbi:hypothetical protein H1Q78_05575 [Cellulosimicrobium cellulans]|uniref:hypothetical protein n=1 Tax=Cellulosimicrobium cellulans TaxID=1710 RepID=UPI001EDB3E6D|nr:hypothetical protein [Cellulosimicrobium cellulans]UKJ64855.1 hypothetical protein H1Q78_05575 [Cellulosimicrobium cellulans]